jgi:hypothetical protein
MVKKKKILFRKVCRLTKISKEKIWKAVCEEYPAELRTDSMHNIHSMMK